MGKKEEVTEWLPAPYEEGKARGGGGKGRGVLIDVLVEGEKKKEKKRFWLPMNRRIFPGKKKNVK